MILLEAGLATLFAQQDFLNETSDQRLLRRGLLGLDIRFQLRGPKNTKTGLVGEM